MSAVPVAKPAPGRERDRGAAIEISGLQHGYRTPDGPLQVLDGVELSLPAGGYLSLTGASGAGKSTLLAIIGGIDRPQQGTVRIGEVDLAALRGSRLAAYRRLDVGFVFQSFGLVDVLTAEENVAMALRLSKVSARAAARAAREVLEHVGLADRAHHRPAALSGGERQRVAIARALVSQPRLLLADEPTGNLDEDTAEEVIELLEQLQQGRGCTLILATHNRRLAARAATRVRLSRGRLEPG